MDTREKLIEILLQKPNKCTFEQLADFLIANGVTVIEWISVKDRLLEEDGEYITMTNATGKENGVLAQKYRTSHVRGQKIRRWYWLERLSPWKITHWVSLPDPPKGE